MPDDFETSITFSIPEDTRQHLTNAFGPFPDDEVEREIIEKFTNLAFNEFVDWISGKKKYRSITELYIDWIESLYLNIYPEDEAPSVDRIYNSLNMPYGQATYIARVLADKTLVKWREVAKRELLDSLRNEEEDAKRHINEGFEDQEITIQVSRIASRELKRVCSYRRHQSSDYLLPRFLGYSGDFQFISIPSCTIINLIENPKW